MEYEWIMKKEQLTQSELARKLGISRVRVNQILKLIKLPQEQRDHILDNVNKELITERKLRTLLAA